MWQWLIFMTETQAPMKLGKYINEISKTSVDNVKDLRQTVQKIIFLNC